MSATATNLTPKQQKFVDEYLVDLNATQAAIRAGYSEKTARQMATENLSKPNIAKAIEERQKALQEKTGITQERVLAELKNLAFLDIRKLFNDDGSLKNIKDLDDDTAAAVAGLDVYTERGSGDTPAIGTTSKIKLVDKRGSLELLMRHMGMLNDKLNVGGQKDNPLVMLINQLNGTGVPVVDKPE